MIFFDSGFDEDGDIVDKDDGDDDSDVADKAGTAIGVSVCVRSVTPGPEILQNLAKR